ncbi:putative bifunctional diguanylate cyclase/phosphodiesterase [Stutzerimonas stutzeri]|uniref:putative bifunctional diguanylate cyclase/phosphodiesterase n=1 Tax=Stutzerimonas stutzeri TaxID=316 RepID=UPI0015E3F7C4|nr:EAL domain-containing protein [Stutzerimonas stutzeri]MBA1262436.1 EAL domain-containing protein [Stutzerimonas stutzeri]
MLTRMPLRLSLPLLLGLFAALFTLLLTTFQVPGSIEEAVQDWQNRTKQHFALLQSSLSDHVRQGRTTELEIELADLASLDGIVWAMVIDRELRIVAATRLDLQADQLDAISPAALKAHVRRGHPIWLPLAGQRQLAIYPLDRTGQIPARQHDALLVELDFTTQLQQIKRDAWGYLAQILALLFFLGLALNFFYGRLITRRLARVEQAARHFAAHHLPQAPAVGGRDEIATLARTLSQMMHQLYDRQAALSESGRMMRDLINTAPVGMLVVDHELRIEQANLAAARLFARTPLELIATAVEDLLLDQDAAQRMLDKSTALELTGLRNGQQVPLEVSCTPFRHRKTQHYLLLLRDISERLETEQNLRFLAHYDPLTHLANRHYLVQRLEHLLSQGTHLSLLFIDIDHFKRINDALGHEVGDFLLVKIATRLTRLTPAPSVLARSGGDEFMLLLEAVEPSDALALGQRIIDDLAPAIRIGQYECRISPSIGIASSSGSGTANDLLKQVDLALYAAKDAGRNCIVAYSDTLGAVAERRHQLELELRQALECEQFVLHFQPQVDSQGRPRAMEALLRWQSPSRGLVPPSDFIPVLEESGMIIDVTRWVFRQACRQARLWQQGKHRIRIAVNLSPLDFRQADLAGCLRDILHEEDVSPELLELEITESALLAADEHVQTTLTRLRALGMPLLLDDFGTGYASLTYLQKFAFDGIKIDREFVADLPDSAHSVALVRGILIMASHLGLHVVAEGVENERQAAFLLLNDCPSLQGYFYSRPQPAEQCCLNRYDVLPSARA